MIFFKRLHSFVQRIIWYSKVKPTVLHAIVDLVRIKIDATYQPVAKYKKSKFQFIASDMSAIKEVLIDQEYSFLSDRLSHIENPMVIDAGANIGTFSMWLLNEKSNARIISIEASKKTYQTLSSNIAMNDFVGWYSLYGAAWKNNDFISFQMDGDSMGHKVSDQGGHKVKGVTLADLITEAEKLEANTIDILKIDIEGAEESFLIDTEATRQALSHVTALVVELHPNYCNTEGVVSLLKDVYQNVEHQEEGRISTKPLLYCY